VLLATSVWASDYEEFVEREGYAILVPVLKITLGSQAVAQSEDAEFKRKYCELVRRGHGVPIVIDRTLREEAIEALGRKKTNQLLLPVARANNAVRCFCYEGAAKARLKCG
jgi:hypothetical protein